LVDCGDFPQPIQISERRQLFRDDDIFDWLEERDLDRTHAIHDDETFDDEWDDEDDEDQVPNIRFMKYEVDFRLVG